MKPRLLWACPQNLHDTSSGAAMSIKAMLEALQQRGVEVRVLASMVFDSPTGMTRFEGVKEQIAATEKRFLELEENGITYFYQKTANSSWEAMTNKDEREYFARFCHELTEFKPDAILHFGGSLLEMGIRSECRRRGIPVVFSVHNGNYKGWNFTDCDMVLVNSRAMADYYYKHCKINAYAYGTFAAKEPVFAPKGTRNPRYVTFINPCGAKGVSLVIRLVQMAIEALPQQRFLMVQGRGNWYAALQHYNMKPEDFPNVDVARHTPDMRSIYAATKVLLAPSLWYEAYPRVVIEALYNHIPVLGSTSGGIPEAVNGGGITLDAPKATQDEWLRLPAPDEMAPWMDALTDMLQHSEKWQKKAAKAEKWHNPEVNGNNLREALNYVFHRRASLGPHIFKS